MQRTMRARIKGFELRQRLEDFLSASSIRQKNNFEYNRIVFRYAMFCNELRRVSVLVITPIFPIDRIAQQQMNPTNAYSRTRTRLKPCYPNTHSAVARNCRHAPLPVPQKRPRMARRWTVPPAHCSDAHLE